MEAAEAELARTPRRTSELNSFPINALVEVRGDGKYVIIC